MNKVLRLSSQKDPLTLDPQKSGDKFSSAVIFLLFKGLTRLEANRHITCDLAKAFHVTNNYKKYIFYLGEHFWSDGSPITAHDFVYSWKRALEPSFPVRATNFFYPIKNAEKAKKGFISNEKIKVYAKEDLTLIVELEYPCPYFLELTSFCPLFPVCSKAKEDEIFSICSGAFQMQHWEYGKELLLRKNHACADSNLIHLEGIHIQIVPDARKAFSLFENDELDWIGDPISPLPLNYLPALLWTKKIQPVVSLASCWFNTLKFPFNNLNLRKALGYAIPRQKIIEKLLIPNILLAERLSPFILQESNTSFAIKECSSSARHFFQLGMKEQKIKNLKISLTCEASDEFLRLAMLLKTHWEELFSLSLQIEPLSFKEFWQRLSQKQFEMSLFCSHSQYTDIINFLERFEFGSVPRNFSGWENRQYKLLLQQYRKTTAGEKREDLVRKAESILLHDMPIAPIYYYHFSSLQKTHVRNLSISPIGVMQFDRVFLEKRQQSFLGNPQLRDFHNSSK